MTDRVLVPTDGSELSRRALEYAIENHADAAIVALHVIPVPGGYWAAYGHTEDEIPGYHRAREYAEEITGDASEIAAERDHPIDTEITVGKPAHEIVTRAVDGGFDAIVLGSHGRDGVQRLLLGSVAEKVVRRSPIPVVVVR
jgi:nucleotide-binding universal stress UspA family protein